MTVRKLELVEYEPLELAQAELSVGEADAIWRAGEKRVSVESPGPQTGGMWRIISNGWVGFLPVAPDLGIALKPRVALGNVFRMLEYAYNLKSFEMFEGIVDCSSMEEFYERLANILAHRAMDRARRGLYRSYLEWDERLSCVRGRIDVRRALARPWDPALRCHFEEHTADVEENQILVHTLSTIARSGICTERVLPTVRNAFRAISGFATHHTVSPAMCLGRLYNRLNEDYQPMHALCRFFLEHAGPTLQVGDHDMIPFVLNMPRLFEQFVAEWTKSHVRSPFQMKSQWAMSFGQSGELNIRIDLMILDAQTGDVLSVLDTKYKTPDRPDESDIQQVVAYAVANDCRDAVLVYPRQLKNMIDVPWGEVRVRTLAFDLGRDLEGAGQEFLDRLSRGLRHEEAGDENRC